ncbi:MAG: hypothetical protein HY690_17895 [Chloroflexi bacterium]|nr:hypothetical protein [Chloroflexota bacterium]
MYTLPENQPIPIAGAIAMPVTVEVIAYAPTSFQHCTHCEVVWHELGVQQKVQREQLEAGIPEDLRQDFLRLSGWVHSLVERYGDQLVVRVVDVVSIEGVYKSLRYGARTYPAIIVIVDGQAVAVGGDYARAEAVLAARLGAPSGAGQKGGEAY